MMANGYRVSFQGDENVLYEEVVMAHNSVNILNPAALCNLIVQFYGR